MSTVIKINTNMNPAFATVPDSSGTGITSIRYTFTGGEGTSFNVPLPAAVNTDYAIFVQLVSVDQFVQILCPIAGRTATQFQVTMTDVLAAGSIVEFGISPSPTAE
jgi:hypothetical protein